MRKLFLFLLVFVFCNLARSATVTVDGSDYRLTINFWLESDSEKAYVKWNWTRSLTPPKTSSGGASGDVRFLVNGNPLWNYNRIFVPSGSELSGEGQTSVDLNDRNVVGTTVAYGGVNYTITATTSPGVDPDPVPDQEWGDVITNESDIAQTWHLRFEDMDGNLLHSQSVTLKPGESRAIGATFNQPFRVSATFPGWDEFGNYGLSAAPIGESGESATRWDGTYQSGLELTTSVDVPGGESDIAMTLQTGLQTIGTAMDTQSGKIDTTNSRLSTANSRLASILAENEQSNNLLTALIAAYGEGNTDALLSQILGSLGSMLNKDNQTISELVIQSGLLEELRDKDSTLSNEGDLHVEVDGLQDVLGQDYLNSIKSNTALTLNQTVIARDYLEEIRDGQSLNGGKLDGIKGAIDGVKDAIEAQEEEEEEEPVDFMISEAQTLATNAGTAAQNAVQGVVDGVPSASGGYSGGGNGVWPSITLPVIGLVDFDPYKHFPWLSLFAEWIFKLIKWASSLAFMRWFWGQLIEAQETILNTPVQISSGVGGLLPNLSSLKHLALATAFVAVAIGLIVGALTVMTDSVVSVAGLTEMIGGDVVSGAQAAVLNGLKIIGAFIPIDHLITLALLAILVQKLRIPLVMGVSMALRLFTV